MDPEPTWEILQTFYGSNYGLYDSTRDDPSKEAVSAKYRIARWRYAGFCSPGITPKMLELAGYLGEVVTGKTVTFSLGLPLQLPLDAHIFELGYGSGNWLLSMAELGYNQLSGYDIDANAMQTERLRSRGVATYSGIFIDEDVPLSDFDCIRLEHVFEHLLSPVAVLAKCRSMMKAHGILVMNLPAWGSLSEKVTLAGHPSLELPRHLYRHTERSARLMLESAGFEVLDSKKYAVSRHLGVAVNEVRDRRGRSPLPLWLSDSLGPLYSIASRILGRGEHLTIVASPAKTVP